MNVCKLKLKANIAQNIYAMKKYVPGLIFGVFMMLIQIGIGLIGSNENRSLSKLVIGAAISGLIAGVLFGWIMYMFANSKRLKSNATPASFLARTRLLKHLQTILKVWKLLVAGCF